MTHNVIAVKTTKMMEAKKAAMKLKPAILLFPKKLNRRFTSCGGVMFPAMKCMIETAAVAIMKAMVTEKKVIKSLLRAFKVMHKE